jgi:hypothetical protein
MGKLLADLVVGARGNVVRPFGRGNGLQEVALELHSFGRLERQAHTAEVERALVDAVGRHLRDDGAGRAAVGAVERDASEIEHRARRQWDDHLRAHASVHPSDEEAVIRAPVRTDDVEHRKPPVVFVQPCSFVEVGVEQHAALLHADAAVVLLRLMQEPGNVFGAHGRSFVLACRT